MENLLNRQKVIEKSSKYGASSPLKSNKVLTPPPLSMAPSNPLLLAIHSFIGYNTGTRSLISQFEQKATKGLSHPLLYLILRRAIHHSP